MRSRILSLCILSLLAASCSSGGLREPAGDHSAEIAAYRAEREERLRQEDGWLSLVGLFWLAPGENRFGSDPGNAIVFPEGSAPAVAGSFHYDGAKVRMAAEPGAER